MKIVTDSASNIISLEGISFASVPIRVLTDKKEYVDDSEAGVAAMVEELSVYKGKSRTSCPAPGDWIEAFGGEDEIFVTTITSGLSGSYNSAMVAKRQYEDENPGKKVFVIDSLSAGPELGLTIYKLRELILEGKDFDTVSKEKCTIVWLLVPWALDILEAIDTGKVNPADYELSQWRLMHIGAQPVPQSLINRWKHYFPNHQYDTNYGLSESIGPGCVHLGIENIHKVGAIGIPGYGWQVKIIDEQGNEVKQGEVGELAVKGPGVMKCYYNNPQATAEVLHDGWLWTGDMARQDEDGFYFLVDRKKDVVISGGENLYPVEIENFMSRFDKIKDVAVIGLPDKRLGEIAAAIVELKDGAECTEEEINEFCLGMPRYKRPKKIIFAPVPRNATGKIEKPKLRKMYCGDNMIEKENQS